MMRNFKLNWLQETRHCGGLDVLDDESDKQLNISHHLVQVMSRYENQIISYLIAY